MNLFFLLLFSLIFISVASIWLYRSVSRKKHFFQLNKAVEGKLDWVADKVKPGDTGQTTTRLAPVGKALINSHEFEVTSISDLIERGAAIEVVEVSKNKITVKLN